MSSSQGGVNECSLDGYFKLFLQALKTHVLTL
jgi:hypothetical protein